MFVIKQGFEIGVWELGVSAGLLGLWLMRNWDVGRGVDDDAEKISGGYSMCTWCVCLNMLQLEAYTVVGCVFSHFAFRISHSTDACSWNGWMKRTASSCRSSHPIDACVNYGGGILASKLCISGSRILYMRIQLAIMSIFFSSCYFGQCFTKKHHIRLSPNKRQVSINII